MRFTLGPILVSGVLAFGLAASGCGEYYYGDASYPDAYNASAPANNANPGSVSAIPGNGPAVGAVDTNAQFEGSGGQDVMVGETNDYADTDPSALTDFRSTLDPYGNWYDDSTYGTVWQPSPSVVGADFAPYVTAGHWTYDDDDYTWVSDYDWGWAPFHYGRWVYIGMRGWCWVPGRTYAGAWVSWRVGDPDYGYVGWGPLPPSWYWRDGYAYGLGFALYTPYTFCGRGDLFDSHVGGHVIGGARVATVAGGTHVYVPSNRGGGDGRTPAHPQVGGSVGGGPGRLHMPFGPPPSMLGFGEHVAPHAPIDNAGLLRAQQFAHPSTATALGAHGPRLASHPTQVPYPPRGTIGAVNRPVATAPQYNYPNGTHYAPPAYYRSAPPSAAYRGSQQPPSASNPSSPWSYSSRSAPMYRGGASSPPAYRSAPSSPAYRSAPPSYHSSPSAPSYHSSPSAPSYHSAPSYRGGGSSSSSSSSSSHSYSHSSGGRHR